MNSVYNNNLSAFQEKYKGVDEIADVSNFHVELGKKGYPTLKYSNDHVQYYFHSKYDPINEAKRWADSFYEEGKLFFLIGIGLGYRAKALSELIGDEERIIIVEPSLEIFQLALQNIDLTTLINHKQVFFYIDNNYTNLSSLLDNVKRNHFMKFKIDVFHHYDKLFEDEVKGIYKVIEESIMFNKVDHNTRMFFSTQWQENYIRNLIHVINSTPFQKLENKFNLPVVIVSAGPSLKEAIPYLKTIYKRAIIVCAGSAITVLQKHNIKPHLIVSIDGSLNNYEHFKNLDDTDIPLFYSPHLHYKILENHKGPKIVFQSNADVNSWYSEIIGFETGKVRQGFSVANGALDIARKISNGPICFVGQDLGYTGGYSHPEGHNHRENQESFKEKGRKLFPIEANDGSELYTDYVYFGMKKWFEDFIKLNNMENVYNATSKGAKITGTTSISFSDFIEKFCTIEADIKGQLSKIIYENKNRTFDINNQEKLKGIQQNISDLLDYSNQGEKIARKLLEAVQRNRHDIKKIKKLLGQLNDVDKKISQVEDKDFLLYFIKQPLMIKMDYWGQEKKNFDMDKAESDIYTAEKNYYFYKEFKNMIKKIHEIFEVTEWYNGKTLSRSS